jgi:photosystem II stability/assembly factor-like uncharacterized protein
MKSVLPLLVPVLALLSCAPRKTAPGGAPPPLPATAPHPAPPSTEVPRQVGPAELLSQNSGTTQRLQAVSVVSDKIAWASGTGGSFVLTRDGGTTWLTGTVPGADSLEFRDIHAVDGRTAYLLSSGPGTRSRIYKTEDGGENWAIQFVNREPEAFYDCFAFWDDKSGLAFSDNVRGHFPILRTLDGGLHWDSVTTAPPATTGEGAFAASGTCVATLGKDAAWIATGAGQQARILYTPDRGETWQSLTTPIHQGTSTTGHTSVAFRSARDGIAVGGDIGRADGDSATVVFTTDGGRSWTMGGHLTFAGAAYGVAYVPGSGTRVVAVGPKGASWSPDQGRTWQPLDSLAYWSVGFADHKAGWLVGPAGRITKVGF